MVNAWATQAGAALGQYKVDTKSNEIKAIPILLDQLALQGCLVTMDAIGCQKAIAHKVIERQADYLLCVKKNQKTLYRDIEKHFTTYWETHPQDTLGVGFAEQIEQGHGRQEHRRSWVFDASELAQQSEWNIQTIAAVQADRVSQGKGSSHLRFYISSRILSAEEVLKATRQHWEVENKLHWVLDVSFNEDQSRARQGYAAENLATTRQIALNLLKKENGLKLGIKNKRKACGWDDNYLFRRLSR